MPTDARPRFRADEEYILNGSSNTNVEWTTSGTGAFINTTHLNTTYKPSLADILDGQVQLRLTTTAGVSCTNISDEMTLTIWRQPIVNAGNDGSICGNGSYQVLDATATDYASILWTSNGTGTLTGDTSLSPVYTPGAAEIGSITLRMTATPLNPKCVVVSDEVILIVAVCNPIAVNDNPTTVEDIPVSGNVIINNDIDPNIPALPLAVNQFVIGGTTYLIPSGGNNTATIPGVGTLYIESDGDYTFTPEEHFNGPVPIATYTITNGTKTDTAELSITIIRFNDAPVAGISSMTSQFNPGGTNSLSVPANKFSGTDSDGTIASIKITSLPGNALSIIIDGMTYTSSTFPVAGIVISTNTAGQPLLDIAIDPFDGVVTSVISYFVIDNQGKESLNTGTITIPFTGLSVSGNVYDDVTGLSDNIVNGTGTSQVIYINLVNSLNRVVASIPVSLIGTYSFTEADGLSVNTTYKLILTNSLQTEGSTLSMATYPAGIVSTGENIGSGIGSDGNIDGILSVDTNLGSLTNANFGIIGAMSVSAGADAVICTTGSTNYTLNGSAANATSVLWTTNGTGNFTNPNMVNAVYNPGAADIETGEVQLTLSAYGVGSVGLISDQMTLTLWPEATAYAGINQSVCRGDVYQVLDAHVTNEANVLWTVNAGATGILSGETTLTPLYTPGAGEIGTITLTLSVVPKGTGTCGIVTSSKTLTITDPPTVVLGPDINNCALNETTLTGIATNYSSLEWSTSGTGTFSALNSLTTNYTPSVADINYAQVTLRLTAKGNGSCISVSDELVLKLWRNTYAFAGNDITVCSSQPYQVLDAEATDYVGLSWTHNGTGTLTNSHTLSPVYTPGVNETGAVILTLTVIPEGSGTCPVFTDQKVITIGGLPIVSCPAGGPFMVWNTPGKCGYVVPNTSWDATATGCNGMITLTHNYGEWGNPYSLAGATFPIGITNVVWTAKDAFGNSSSCSISINVSDNEPPSFVNCESGKTFNIGLSADDCQTGVIWSIPVAADNCSNSVYVSQTKGPALGSLLSAGTYEIQYTGIDNSNNYTICSFFIKITDTERPFVVCRPDFEVKADNGLCTWSSPVNSLSPLLARSNCESTVSWEVINPDGTKAGGLNDVSGYTFRKGTSTVKYSNKETASNQTWDCSFKVTVVDKDPPQIICPAPIVQLSSFGCNASVSLMAPIFTDCSASVSTSYKVIAPDNSETAALTSSTHTFKTGISRVIWTVTDQAGNSANCTQQVTVTANASILNPSAGSDAIICENSVYKLSGASAENYTTLKWTTDGSGKFDNAGNLHPIYTPSLADIINGEIVLKLTVSSECASSTSSMTLVINRNSEVRTGTAKEAFICEGSAFALTGASQTNATSIKWTTSGTGSFANSVALNTTYLPSAADLASGSVILTLTGESATPCSKSSDSLILHLIRQATANAGADATICEGSLFDVTTATATNASGITWKTSGTGTFSNSKSISTTYLPSASDLMNGVVYLTLTATAEYPCQTIQDELVLSISKQPKAYTGVDMEACSGEIVKINKASAINYISVLWTTTGKGNLTSPTSLQPTYMPATGEKGVIQFILTANGSNACGKMISKDTMTVTYHQELQIDVMAADTILYDTSATLNVSGINGTGNYIYRWEPSNLVPNFNSNRAQTIPLTETTLFTVTITDVHTGCTATEQVMVNVEKQIDNLLEFYNGLTPNGDGNNDTWWIDGIEKFPDNEVMIFNRWGDKIIELRNYDNVRVTWDGKTSHGNQVPDGTYYYLVKIRNVKSYTGWINIRTGN